METMFYKVTCRDKETGGVFDRFFKIDQLTGSIDTEDLVILSKSLMTHEEYLNDKLDTYFNSYVSSVKYGHSCEDKFLAGNLSFNVYECSMALNDEYIEVVKKQLRSVMRRMQRSGYEIPRKEVILNIIKE